tara:strand:+ start:11025 stop:11195 length:171 start_codon:yes stop_codon:yes gene_type:complete
MKIEDILELERQNIESKQRVALAKAKRETQQELLCIGTQFIAAQTVIIVMGALCHD